MSVSHDEGTQKDGLLRAIRWGFWIAAVLGVYLGSYWLLMCDVPAINENGTMTHASSFRFADSISVRTPFSIAMPRETWLNKLYLPLDYAWGRGSVDYPKAKEDRDRQAAASAFEGPVSFSKGTVGYGTSLEPLLRNTAGGKILAYVRERYPCLTARVSITIEGLSLDEAMESLQSKVGQDIPCRMEGSGFQRIDYLYVGQCPVLKVLVFLAHLSGATLALEEDGIVFVKQ